MHGLHAYLDTIAFAIESDHILLMIIILGEIWLQPSDRQLKGAKVKLEVRVVSENPLQVAHKEVLQVMRGGKAVIDSRHLTLMGIGGSTSSSSIILISLLRGKYAYTIHSKYC